MNIEQGTELTPELTPLTPGNQTQNLQCSWQIL